MAETTWFHLRVEEAQQWTEADELCLPVSDRLINFIWHRTGQEPTDACFSGLTAAMLKLSRSFQRWELGQL
jgi:hypothetical protein